MFLEECVSELEEPKTAGELSARGVPNDEHTSISYTGYTVA